MLVCQYLISEFSAGGSLDPKGRGNACASYVDEFSVSYRKVRLLSQYPCRRRHHTIQGVKCVEALEGRRREGYRASRSIVLGKENFSR
jgi:hypothetical protein